MSLSGGMSDGYRTAVFRPAPVFGANDETTNAFDEQSLDAKEDRVIEQITLDWGGPSAATLEYIDLSAGDYFRAAVTAQVYMGAAAGDPPSAGDPPTDDNEYLGSMRQWIYLHSDGTTKRASLSTPSGPVQLLQEDVSYDWDEGVTLNCGMGGEVSTQITNVGTTSFRPRFVIHYRKV